MYGSVCWTINKKNKIKTKVTDMRVLRCMCSVTSYIKIRNEIRHIRCLRVTIITRNFRENRLRRY